VAAQHPSDERPALLDHISHFEGVEAFPDLGDGGSPWLAYLQRALGRRSSTRLALVAAVAAVAACIVSPLASTASYTITTDGSALVVTVSTAGSTSHATFTGVAGHRISLKISNVTITSTKVSILKPDGTNLLTPFTVLKSGYYMDAKSLPVGGTYKIVVDPKYDYTGKMTLRLYDVPADPTGTITTAAPVTVTTTVPGQNAVLTFAGTAGHRLAVNLTDSTYNNAKLRIKNPDTTLLAPAKTFGGTGIFFEPTSLPATGDYTLQIDPTLDAVGSVTVQVYDVPNDASTAVTPCSSLPCSPGPTTATTTVAGQNAGLTFVGTAGQRISVVAGNSVYASTVKVSLLKPDLTPVTSPPIVVGGLDGFIEPQTLPANGTYTVLVDPQLADVGSIDVQVYLVPNNVTGTISSGTPVTVTTTVPGQNAVYTFTGSSTQRVSVNLSNVTYGSAKVSILKPDGTNLTSPLFVPNTFGNFVEPVKLPVNGTYKIVVDPTGASTGSTDIGLWFVPGDVTGSVTANVAKHVSITTPGQNSVLTYAGTSGQRITVEVNNVTLGTTECCNAKLKITKPDGSTLQTSLEFGTLGTYVDVKSLTATGTYKIWIDPIDEAVGDFDLLLRIVPPDASATSGALTSGGTNVNVTTVAPGQGAKVNFSASAGQRFAFKLVSFGGGFCDVKLALYDPNGTKLTGPTCAPNDTFFDTRVLPIAGTYKITVDPQGSAVGTANLTLYAVPADIVAAAPFNGSAVTLTPGQNAYLAFAAISGQTATVTPNAGGSISLARAALYKADKTTQVGGAQFWDPSFGDPVASSIPATATYYLKYDPVGGASGTSMTFVLSFS
jgi:hypothetical protein